MSESWPLAHRQVEVDLVLAAFENPARRAVVLYGTAGVGKTRLADTCLAMADERGRLTARVMGSQAAALLPLGALAPILPSSLEPGASPAALYERTRGELSALGGGGPLVVLVDDAHLLDTSSAVLLTQLIEASAVFVLATIRDGEALPDAVAGWWRRDDTLRLDLRDLGPDATGTVLTSVLPGAVGAETIAQLHRSSGGNPLLLRELVHQAITGGQLTDASGAWRLAGTITPSRRLVDVLAARLAGLSPVLRRVLDQLAVCEQLSWAELDGDASLSDLEELEHTGLIQARVDGRRHQLVLGHPLYGEVLRAQLTVLGRRTILERAAERLARLGSQRREDTRRIATWRLEAGGKADPELLLQAARFARYANDFGEVERLCGVLWAESPSAETAVLLGEAHYELGHFDQAEAILSAPLPPDSPDELLIQRAALRGQNLQWGLGDWRAALETAVEARETIGGQHADDLLIREAGVWTFAGQPQRALDLIARIHPRTARTRVLLAIARGQALPMVGRPTEALAVTVEGYREHSALSEPLALDHPGIHIVNQMFASVGAGRFTEADELGRLGHAMTLADNIPFAQIWFAVILGTSAVQQGRLLEARHWAGEATSTARLLGLRGPERIACGVLAASEAQLGNADGAARAMARVNELPPFDLHHFDQATAWAWVTWVSGEPELARRQLVENAKAAAGQDNVTAAAWSWHDAARLGARQVAPHLALLAERSDSPVVAARADHVRVLEADDPVGLIAAVARFEDLGMNLLAAEAAASAAEAHRRRGDQRMATSCGARAEALAKLCPGARTPGLATLRTTVPLSTREREVATLAGQGLASQDIADRLFISIRTVNNHLASAYSKLGVHGRDELAEALAES